MTVWPLAIGDTHSILQVYEVNVALHWVHTLLLELLLVRA